MTPIWYFDNCGCADESRDADRWSLSVEKDENWTWSLRKGLLVNQWAEPVLSAGEDGPLEDMPWVGFAHVVSTRFREFLEAEYPGHAQYLPVHITRYGKPMKIPQYWAVNWLNLIECIDHERSDYKVNYYGGIKKLSMNKLVVDLKKVPEHVKVWRVLDYSVCIARDEVRTRLYQTDFVGFQFYPANASP